MIIVSQNKNKIINFDNVNYLQVGKIVDNEFSIEINYDDCNFIRIATYKTEERAEEVLQEIMQSYIYNEERKYCSRFFDDNQLQITKQSMLYEMPEE